MHEVIREAGAAQADTTQAEGASFQPDAEEGGRARLTDPERYPSAVEEYNAHPDTEGGRLLDVDIARELILEYVKDRSQSHRFQDEVSAFIKKRYAELLGQPVAEGREARVILTAGGSGAGKSTARKTALDGLSEKADIIYDGTMAKVESSLEKIDQALASGRRVSVVYVHRDPIDSWVNGVFPRAEAQGRAVPLDFHHDSHLNSRPTVETLMDIYKDAHYVEFRALDNSRGLGKAKEISLAEIVKPEAAGLKEKLRHGLNEAYRTGRISQKTYEGSIPAVADVGRGGEKGNGQDRRTDALQSQQGNSEQVTPSPPALNLQPAAPTDSSEFRAWFGDSKVVDAEGKPLRMLHGTSYAGFDSFDTHGGEFGLFGDGSYFTDNAEAAYGYTKKGRGSNPAIYPVFLSIRNPIDMDAKANAEAWGDTYQAREYGIIFKNGITNEEAFKTMLQYFKREEFLDSDARDIIRGALEGMGYDGITHTGGRKDTSALKHRVYIAFSPTQIKSVFNKGTWDSNDPRINYQPALESARSYAAWEEFRDDTEATWSWMGDEHAPETLSPEEKDAWYKRIWEEAQQAAETNGGNIEEPAPTTVEAFTEALKAPRALESFLYDMGLVEAGVRSFREAGPTDAEEYQQMEKLGELRDTLRREVHPLILNTADGLARSGRQFVKPATRAAIMTIIEHGAMDYAALAGEIRNDEALRTAAKESIGERTKRFGKLKDPRAAKWETLAISDRARLADKFTNEETKRKIGKGEINSDEIKALVDSLDEELKAATAEQAKLEKEIKDQDFTLGRNEVTGSSPRVWGEGCSEVSLYRHSRLIPTRVGRGIPAQFTGSIRAAHPHACGERGVRESAMFSSTGSSPRVWGEDHHVCNLPVPHRLIPTRVGRGRTTRERRNSPTAHPHACGERLMALCAASAMLGSSPRVWGEESRQGIPFTIPRLIPTRVGRGSIQRA